MHIQAKSNVAASPADLAAFLEVLARDEGSGPINIEGVTGSGVETGGGLVFTMAHHQHEEGVQRLRDAGYTVDETVDLYAEEVVVPPEVSIKDPNRAGVLLQIVLNARASSIANGRPIDQVLFAARTGMRGRYYVQVTFVDAPFFDPDV
jgi:hypothetical protein